MRRWLHANALVIAACAGCQGASTGHAVAPAPAPSFSMEALVPPGPPHPDFARLRMYRNYYKLERVLAYEHHFAVWYLHLERCVDYYAVGLDGRVRSEGGDWGASLRAGRRCRRCRRSQMRSARTRAVMAQFEVDKQEASRVTVEYLGSYRKVVVGEVVPLTGPGDPFARGAWHVTATLRANAELTSIDGIARIDGGASFLCWATSQGRDCRDPH